MPLLVATGNPGKLAEFRRLLADVEIVSPADVGLGTLAVEETGETFRDNALLKARAYARAAGCIAIADDSGLQVDALDGAPGVHSARFGGPDLSDADRCHLLLNKLRHVPTKDRGARFRCHLAACPPEGDPIVEAEGVCEGQIAPLLQGTSGFGYDPLFLVNDLGATMAQISTTQKNEISHRGRAIRALRGPLLLAFPDLRTES